MSSKLGVRDCNCNALRRAARRISNFYDGELAASGLRATQFAILASINDMDDATASAIAERLALDRTTMGRNLRPLEREGLIKRGASVQDGRSRTITLSKAGFEKLKKAVPLWRRAQSRFERNNDPAKVASLRKALAGLKIN